MRAPTSARSAARRGVRSSNGHPRSHERGFVVEQEALTLEASGVTGQVATRADHAMARDDDRDRIASVGQADCPRGRRPLELARELSVRGGGAVGDLEQAPPDALEEGTPAAHLQRDVELEALAGEVLLELVAHPREWLLRPPRVAHDLGRMATGDGVQTGQALLVAAQEQRPDRT